MTIKDNIIDFLKSNNLNDKIEEIFKKAPEFNKNPIEYLIDIEKIEEDSFLKFFQKKYKIPIKKDYLEIPIKERTDYYIVFNDNDVGIFFPANKKIVQNKFPGKNVKLVPYSFLKEKDFKNIEGLKGIIINLIKQTKDKNATDIHFENKEFGAIVRIRLLGELTEIAKFQKDIAYQLLKIVKNMAAQYTPGFDPEEFREVQDARIELPNLNLGIRISFAPSIYDYDNNKMQNFVMRLLSKEKKKVKGIEELYKLGYEEEDAKILMKNAKAKTGLIIMSGATGSGKSLTFNTLLALLPKELKILSAEDPVEYALDNAVQHQILEFVKKVAGQDKLVQVGYMEYMRGFMRQDPDVIFIGEWRKNPELTESLVYAAETGHLVYTTLHSSRVVNVPNLLITQYGLKPEDLENNVNLIINQRLIKRICQNCSEEYIVTEQEIEEIKKIIRFKDKEKLNQLIGLKIKKANKNGCNKCIIKNNKGEVLSAGYSGRVAIYEYLEFDEEVRKLISETTSTREIENLLIKKIEEKKAKSFVDTVIKKVKYGITDLNELQKGLL